MPPPPKFGGNLEGYATHCLVLQHVTIGAPVVQDDFGRSFLGLHLRFLKRLHWPSHMPSRSTAMYMHKMLRFHNAENTHHVRGGRCGQIVRPHNKMHMPRRAKRERYAVSSIGAWRRIPTECQAHIAVGHQNYSNREYKRSVFYRCWPKAR